MYTQTSVPCISQTLAKRLPGCGQGNARKRSILMRFTMIQHCSGKKPVRTKGEEYSPSKGVQDAHQASRTKGGRRFQPS